MSAGRQTSGGISRVVRGRVPFFSHYTLKENSVNIFLGFLIGGLVVASFVQLIFDVGVSTKLERLEARQDLLEQNLLQSALQPKQTKLDPDVWDLEE